jgi:dTDP-glucose pyrophosphorylase
MRNWNKICISPATSILTAIEIIDKEGSRGALVINENRKLLGVVTDGDIRRCILKKISLEEPIHKIMNCKPTVAYVGESREKMLAQLQTLSLFHLPILNDEHCLVGFETLDSLLAAGRCDNLVVVMAGGMGKRLHPLTLDTPKPLLKIGDKAVLEILLENFIKNGFHRFCFAVNYKAEMIKNYFGSGERWGVSISYLEENKRLGTAGALSLLKDIPNDSFFVINADVVTTLDFQSLLKYHAQMQAEATMCIREQEHVMLYGVVERDVETQFLTKIVEKPVRQYFVNAGIYILTPAVLKLVEPDTFCDMPDLLTTCLECQFKVATFPIKEYWLDIGQHQDLQRAHADYEGAF